MKKAKFYAILIVLLFVSVISLNLKQASAVYEPQEGDIIKVDNDPALYKIDSDGNKRLFVNSVTFWSHYSGDWNNIKYNGNKVTIRVLSQEDFDNIDSSTIHITVKPGRKLIRFQNSPRVYVVYGDANLKQLNSNEAANIYGDDWADHLITIQNGFETDYTRNDNNYIDSDNDGISDDDEVNIYFTEPTNNDTDGDGHKDSEEIFSNYNPIGDNSDDLQLDSVDFEALKDYFSDKYNWDNINISKMSSDLSHFRGAITFIGSTGSDHPGFLMTKVNNKWLLLHDGTDPYSCVLVERYYFPQEMIADCVTENSSEIDSIKEELKHKIDEDYNFDIRSIGSFTINRSGDYLRGEFEYTYQYSTPTFYSIFAVKNNNEWNIVIDNLIPREGNYNCSEVDDYNFPQSLISDCKISE